METSALCGRRRRDVRMTPAMTTCLFTGRWVTLQKQHLQPEDADCTRSVVTTLLSAGGGSLTSIEAAPHRDTRGLRTGLQPKHTGCRAEMSRSPLQFHAGGEWPSSGQSMKNGLEEEGEEGGEGDLDEEADASQLERFMKDRRRAKSLPAYPAALLDGVSGSNGRKRVKFADSMGLNLASVKHFSSLEEPQIPSKVLSRHTSFPPQQQDLLDDLCQGFQSSLDTDRLFACFPELREAERRVQQLRVCLEKVTITQFDVRGQIRVFTGCTDIEVGVRYTFNDWLSHVDAQALPVAADQPGLVGERFGFTVYTPPFMDPSSAVHLAVYLKSEEGEFWDNNEGQNYSLRYRCMPGTTPFVSAAFHAT
ncbi:protein phosphatase 1 regulatory subunit 3G isoform X2 [Siniperca chuatsi]|uniref:protein phosphatase 1 regulatory subunit 3G isoform X2 n=1 Tax=Siniperca chuatsi TaxID=119488 RepID=UPI001CE1573A|nr:protein phosphatase 1 regulatory subunit 3G isoform X2 [Siniperca chuatsi]